MAISRVIIVFTLTSTQPQTIEWLTIRLPAIILGCLITLLVSTFIVGFDWVYLLQMGLFGGFIGGNLGWNTDTRTTTVRNLPSASKYVILMSSVLLGAFVAASFGLSLGSPINADGSSYALGDWMRDGSIFGIGSGLSAWIFQLLLVRCPRQQVPSSSRRSSLHKSIPTWFARIASRRIWQAALVLGTGIGLSDELRAWLSYGLSIGMVYALGDGLIIVGVTVILARVILAGSIESLRFAERISWTWQHLLRPDHLRTSIIVAGAFFFLFGLSAGLAAGLNEGLNQALSYGPSYGLLFGLLFGSLFGLGYALRYGLSTGLGYWLVLGLYRGMKQEHLKDQDRQQFNQGIRRSLHNGLFIGLISALIITAIGALSNGLGEGMMFGPLKGLSYGLSYGLSTARDYVLGTGLILLLPEIVVMWSLSGGLTVLRHYVIRWLLARHHTFPFRAQMFLDDATTRILLRRVGGGYSFIHRRLQDYFADTAAPPSEN